ncbi:hypothetical protein ACIQVO_38705 [Streptomyces sp. NPDC101062]|uniref:hypothetical protein n=1 Tax=unclassified Streptomyces TaxID=2593676 RepID=UPI00382F1756
MFWHRLASSFGRREPFPKIDTITTYPPSAASVRSDGEARTGTSGPSGRSLPPGFHPADNERSAGHPTGPDQPETRSPDRTTLPDADEVQARERMTTAITRFGWGTI